MKDAAEKVRRGATAGSRLDVRAPPVVEEGGQRPSRNLRRPGSSIVKDAATTEKVRRGVTAGSRPEVRTPAVVEEGGQRPTRNPWRSGSSIVKDAATAEVRRGVTARLPACGTHSCGGRGGRATPDSKPLAVGVEHRERRSNGEGPARGGAGSRPAVRGPRWLRRGQRPSRHLRRSGVEHGERRSNGGSTARGGGLLPAWGARTPMVEEGGHRPSRNLRRKFSTDLDPTLVTVGAGD